MKKLLIGLFCCLMLFSLTGCNKAIIDTTYNFDKAIITLHSGNVITVDVQSWKDYNGSDQIQIKATDGTVYLVHSTNCTLIAGD